MIKWIILFIFFSWSFYSWKWYTCEIKDACQTVQFRSDRADEGLDNSAKNYDILFQWKSGEAIFGTGWPTLKSNLKNDLPDDRILEITGWQYKNEPEGIARERAKTIFNEMKDAISADRMVISTMQYKDAGDGSQPIDGVTFRYIDYSEHTASLKVPANDRVDSKAPVPAQSIYFDFASVNAESNINAMNQLKKVVDQLNGRTESIIITGHTDNIGSEEANLLIGQKRAEDIRDILAGFGLPENRMIIASKGESEPIAPNNTTEGRKKNRRVELSFINK